MGVREDQLAEIGQENAQPWVAGPSAIYIGFPNITAYQARQISRGTTTPGPGVASQYQAQVSQSYGCDSFQSAYRQGLLTGDGVPSPGSLIQGSQLTVAFFGWTEKFPTVKLRPTYRPYRTDVGGDEPHDHFYSGASALVSGVMTIWNEAVYDVMGSYAGDFYPGQDTAGAVGRWMGAEGGAYQLFIVFPYQRKPFYGDMRPGYRFLNAWLQDDGGTKGSTARKLHLTWKCQRMYNPADGTYTLYDGNMTFLTGSKVSTAVVLPGGQATRVG